MKYVEKIFSKVICMSVWLLGYMLFPAISFSQYNPEAFGKHNLQYRKFDWKYYEASNFKIYHYDRSGRELARYVVEQVELDLKAIEKRLSGLFPDKVSIVLYNCFDDFEQSNIGLVRSSQFRNNNAAGEIDVVGDKIAVYFDGNHNNLKEQLRLGMAQMVMERMMFGENLREIVRNKVLLDMPKWATLGYVDYVVTGWTADDDNEWKNLVLRNSTTDKTFLALSEAYPQLVGKAILKYIELQYGENSIRNLYYMTQVKSGLNAAMKSTLGVDLKTFYANLLSFYKQHYETEKIKFETPIYEERIGTIPAPKPNERISQIYVSPRGKDVAYVKYKNGEYEVVLEKTNIKESDRRAGVIMKSGVLNHEDAGDPDYPKLAWSNNGFKLGILYKDYNQLWIKVYDANKSKVQVHKIPKNKIDRITGFTFMEDDEFIIFSGIKGGQSDIYEYYIKRKRITPITQDIWDDANPVFVSGGARKGVVFLSNRPNPKIDIGALPNELPVGNLKAYFYNATTKSFDLLPLTQNFEGKIKDIIPYGMDNFSFLSDVSGISNRYVVMFARDVNNMDSAYVIPVTNYANGILFQQYHPSGQNVVDVVQEKENIGVYLKKANLPAPWGNLEAKEIIENSLVNHKQMHFTAGKDDTVRLEQASSNSNDLFNNAKPLYVTPGNDLQSEFDAMDLPTIIQSKEDDAVLFAEQLNIKQNQVVEPSIKPTFYDPINRAYITDTTVIFVDSTFMKLRSSPARSSVKLNYTGFNLDNSVLFNKYQSYMHHFGRYSNPPLSFLLFANLMDQYEDHRFTGGVRMPASLSNISYFAQYENLRGRNDWGFTYYSFSNPQTYSVMFNSNTVVDLNGRSGSHILQFDFSRPLNKTTALKMNLGYRQNYMTIKANEIASLFMPNYKDHWANLHLEYEYDNTINPIYNIWHGLRAKVFGDFMYKINDNNNSLFLHAYDTSKQSYVYNLGFDVRYYIPVFRTSIFAVRASGAHAAGTQQILYFLGGVENSLSPKWDEESTAPSASQNYAYQALATNVRGYKQNFTNGNTFGLVNAELRVPFMSTILNRNTQSSILKSLQLVAFCDAGTAWEGFIATGNRSRHRYNAYVWPSSPQRPITKVTMPGSSNGDLAISCGLGARVKLLGYFLKLDGAYNLNKEFSYHISIGTDF